MLSTLKQLFKEAKHSEKAISERAIWVSGAVEGAILAVVWALVTDILFYYKFISLLLSQLTS
ncbi:MAG: hypothetical protein HY265_03950 [Deltaproteobacteria bacterium]|nr:hypothetical protein [Deltaproteobacteria bacterium]